MGYTESKAATVRILVMGLPGSGKTTLSRVLADRLGAIHFNADRVRETINNHLGFSEDDRLIQAETMRHLCDMANDSGISAVADFVCPTAGTRKAFGRASIMIWMDTIRSSRFPDTNAVFSPPTTVDYRVQEFTQVPKVIHSILQEAARLKKIADSL